MGKSEYREARKEATAVVQVANGSTAWVVVGKKRK